MVLEFLPLKPPPGDVRYVIPLIPALTCFAAFSIGYYYDQVSNADSALKYYQFVVDNYPESEQSSFADERLFSINQALSLIHVDSTSAPELAPN